MLSVRFKIIFTLVLFFVIGMGAIFVFFYYTKPSTRATSVAANLLIDVNKITGPLPTNWKALSQGGEESGVQMLGAVTEQITELSPRYVRIDHIYDFYNVLSRENNTLIFNWENLDKTICDIYKSNSKPFLVLGYMPEILSGDKTLVGLPRDWNEWAHVVQKTIERYSGTNTRLCAGTVYGEQLNNIYYEVWNEPDLETFGAWKLYGTEKDYKLLYNYSVQGANRSQNIYQYYIGGPVTTALYRNWIQGFLSYATSNRLRVDFISWHHYTTNPDDYTDDVDKLNSWLSDPVYLQYRDLPKIITEWGYDPSPNPISETDGGAAYTIASIKNLINKELEMAFSFEIKDGPTHPGWGILNYSGTKKPRFYALRLLNKLFGHQLVVDGEGSFVRAAASIDRGKITSLIVNYDPLDKNTELVPLTFINLTHDKYTLTIHYTQGEPVIFRNIDAIDGKIQRSILMKPNMVLVVEIQAE